MQVLQRLIQVQPPKGIDGVNLHYHEGKGWLVEVFMGKSLGSMNRYIITKEFTIYGVFTAMIMVEKLQEEEYLYPKEWAEQQIIEEVSKWKLKDYKRLTQNAVSEHPILTQLKQAACKK